MIDSEIRGNPGMEPYRDVMLKWIQKYMTWDAMRPELIRLYTDTYTEAELKQLAAFYKTPLGQKTLTKTPELLQKTAMIGARLGQQHADELKTAMTARRDELLKEQEKAQTETRLRASKPAPVLRLHTNLPELYRNKIGRLAEAGVLRQITVGRRNRAFEASDLIALFGPGRQHDDGQLARLTVTLERTRQLEPAHVGEHPINEHQVGSLIGQRGTRRTAILSLPDLEAGTLQPEGDHFAYRALILDDQNLFCGHVIQIVGRGYYRCSMLQIHDKNASR